MLGGPICIMAQYKVVIELQRHGHNAVAVNIRVLDDELHEVVTAVRVASQIFAIFSKVLP